MKNFLILGVALSCVMACTSNEAAPPAKMGTEVETAAPAIPSNATALERYEPLGLVKGGERALESDAGARLSNPEELFEDAISYAEATQSYALLIWHDGALQLEKYFDPHTSDIRAESASMHKSVLGLVTTKALADGKIESVDTPISKWITEWESDPRGDITLRQLLTMSAGLTPLSYEGGVDSPAVRFANGDVDPVETLLNLPDEGFHGDHFHYQNTVSQLLMLVVERALGEPYADYLSREIWQPLGAADAFTHDYSELGFSRGYAAFLARPLDWLRLGLLVKDGGTFERKEIIPSEFVERMIAPSALNPNYGWQIWRGATFEAERYYNEEKAGFAALASEPFLTDDMLYFDGFGGQRVYISRSEDLVIVHLGDTQFDWDDARLPNAVIRALHAE